MFIIYYMQIHIDKSLTNDIVKYNLVFLILTA